MSQITNLHLSLTKNCPRSLEFLKHQDIKAWRKTAKETLVALLGMPEANCSLDVKIEYTKEHDLFTETRFTYQSEAGFRVPAVLSVPKTKSVPFPVMICLQGHSPGMYLSMEEIRSNGDSDLLNGDRGFCIQAINNGFAALAIENRCMGEQRSAEHLASHGGSFCQCDTMIASLVGRTMVGERIFDVMRGIDALAQFRGLDLSDISMMGHSGGGTVTYYAAAVEDRIKAIMPSGSVCTYEKSIISHYHCVDNYIFGIMNYFEMEDIAGLIAPKKMVLVAGRFDPIFEYQGVLNAYEYIKKIYDKYDVSQNLALVTGEGEHRFYAKDTWPVFMKLRNL